MMEVIAVKQPCRKENGNWDQPTQTHGSEIGLQTQRLPKRPCDDGTCGHEERCI